MESGGLVRKQPAPNSAGSVIFRLKPGEEGVVLVLNIDSEEVKRALRSQLTQAERKRIIEDLGDEVIVSFEQPGNFGTPFGKGEADENTIETAKRETLEETGSDISNRLIEGVSYKEVPNSWGSYFNIVYLVNGCGFSVKNDRITDPLIDPRFTKFYRLDRLPFFKRPKNRHERRERALGRDIRYRAGIYNACLRRLVAILLKLDRPLLAELGRPGSDTAEDLVQMIVRRWTYGAFFSRRTMKMFVGQKREDLIIDRLVSDEGKINTLSLAKKIGGNLVLTLKDEHLLERGLEALIGRCDRSLLTGEGNLYEFLGIRFERRKSRVLSSLDQRVVEAEEEALDRELAEELAVPEDEVIDTSEFEAVWLAAEENRAASEDGKPETNPAEEGGEPMPVVKAPKFVACIGAGRACGRASVENSFTCQEHAGATISMPPRVLIRQHFKAGSKYGSVIVDELLARGVLLVERTRARQDELEHRRMRSTGVRVFGEDDIGPNVSVWSAAEEMSEAGYRLKDLHVLSLDGIAEDAEAVGDRTVVFCYEFDPEGESIKMPEAGEVLLAKPFLSCRVWVNLVDASGSQLHAIEQIGYQHQARPGIDLKFLNSLWFPEVVLR